MEKRVVLITGANRGIGLELAKLYVKNADEVIIACRTPTPEVDELKAHVLKEIDLRNPDDRSKIKDFVQNKEIDILINNAGVFLNETLDDFNLDHMRTQWEVNTLAPLALSQQLIPYMKNPSKIVMITSRMGSIGDNTGGAYYGYRMSKAALNAGTKSMAIDLQAKNISACVLHPGFVKTRMTSHMGDITPDVSAQGLFERIENLNETNTGSFWHQNGAPLPW